MAKRKYKKLDSTLGNYGDIGEYPVKDEVPANGTVAQFITANGQWEAKAIAPAGATTQVQYNDGGVFAGDATMVFNKTTKQATFQTVQVGTTAAAASAANVGAIRYRATANDSYCEMCMQTGAATYAWTEIKKNTWV